MVAVSLKKKSSRRRHKGRAEDGIRDVERSRCFFFQAEDGIRDVERSRGLGDVYKRQIFLFLSNSCSKESIQQSTINEKSLDLQVLEAYQGGMEALDGGDVLFAAKKFNEAEILFPQSKWAPKAALMAAYSYYIQDYYGDSIAELERFIKVYPLHKDLVYAYYLLSVCYYEQIVDEKKDLQAIIKAKKNFQIVIKNYPDTEYAMDAEFKIDLINDILAAKEMYIARYYFDKKKWIPAINRFKKITDEYDTTIYAEEALHLSLIHI